MGETPITLAAQHEAGHVAPLLRSGEAAQITVRMIDGHAERTVEIYGEHRQRVARHKQVADPLRTPNFTSVLAAMPAGACPVITMRLEADGSYYWMSEGHGRGRIGD